MNETYRATGFAVMTIPSILVFTIIALQFETGLSVSPVWYPIAYPMGILAILLYSQFSTGGPSWDEHLVDLTKGARLATYFVAFASALVVILPFFFGNAFLGPGLMFASVGTVWMPSVVAAGAYGRLLANGKLKIAEKEFWGTKHGGIAVWFLEWILKRASFFDSPVTLFVIFYVIGWIFISQAGGFPYSILGGSMVILVPLGSRRIIAKTLNQEDRKKLSEILNSGLTEDN